jgi:hypothetical protein
MMSIHRLGFVGVQENFPLNLASLVGNANPVAIVLTDEQVTALVDPFAAGGNGRVIVDLHDGGNRNGENDCPFPLVADGFGRPVKLGHRGGMFRGSGRRLLHPLLAGTADGYPVSGDGSVRQGNRSQNDRNVLHGLFLSYCWTSSTENIQPSWTVKV